MATVEHPIRRAPRGPGPSVGRAGMPLPSRRTIAIALLAIAAAAVAYAGRPGALTDDTYAFLDWGRDLRHGLRPSIEGRTFHPIPVLWGSLVSLIGNAAPTLTVILTMAALLLLAAAAWLIVARLSFRQPAPALAAVLVLISPMLPVLALAAYVNVWFATLIAWVLLLDLAGRRRAAWTLLVVAGLVRPEGWAYLAAYAGLEWWRRGRPREPRAWAPLAALAVCPMVIWIGAEWIAFGSPLYSFTHTAKLAGTAAHTVGHLQVQDELWHDLRDGVTWPVALAAVLGAVRIVQTAPRRLAGSMLTMAVTAPVTVLVLAAAGFNLPSRHWSVVAAMAIVLAAIGVTSPPAVRLGRLRVPMPRGRVAAVIGAGVLTWAVLSISEPTADSVNRSMSASHDTGATLDHTIAAHRAELAALPLERHSVALVGAYPTSELAWALRRPYSVVTGKRVPETRVIVEPSPSTWSTLAQVYLTDQPQPQPPAGWHRLVDGPWRIYLAPELVAALPSTASSPSSSGRQRTLGSIARVSTRSR